MPKIKKNWFVDNRNRKPKDARNHPPWKLLANPRLSFTLGRTILIRIWHPGKIWWRTLDPGDSFMSCAPPMMLLKCWIHILDNGLHEASIATLWFFHGLWSLMMLLHSVQSNVSTLTWQHFTICTSIAKKNYCTLNGCCSVLQTVVGHRQDSPKLHTAWSTLIQNCTQ